MLNAIKSLIKEKTAFQENADLILENTMPANALDDQLVLGESDNDFDYDALKEAGEDVTVDMDLGMEDASDNNDDSGEEAPVDNNEPEDIMNTSIDDDTRNPEPIDTDVNNDHDDIMNTEIDPEPVTDPETLPEPVGAQTGEPINDNNDILSMELDMGSNTPKDILPVPPANAGDAVVNDSDEMDNQRVDSGFGGDTQPNEEPAEPVTDPEVPVETPVENPEEKPAESEAPAEAANEETETPAEDVELEAARIEAFKEFLTESQDPLDLKIDNMIKDINKRYDEMIQSAKKSMEDTIKFAETFDNDTKQQLIDMAKKEYNDTVKQVNADRDWQINDLKGLRKRTEDMINKAFGLKKESAEDNVDAFKTFLEEISLGGDESESSEEKPAESEAPAEAAEASAEPAGDDAPTEAEPEASEEESPVTTAVKDKVAEAELTDDVSTAGGPKSNQEIMNKLSNITKNLEDVKKSIMANMQ